MPEGDTLRRAAEVFRCQAPVVVFRFGLASGLLAARAELLLQRAYRGLCGGERGIRTPGTIAGTTVFKSFKWEH